MNNWISVEDCLPDQGIWVMVYGEPVTDHECCMQTAYFKNDKELLERFPIWHDINWQLPLEYTNLLL